MKKITPMAIVPLVAVTMPTTTPTFAATSSDLPATHASAATSSNLFSDCSFAFGTPISLSVSERVKKVILDLEKGVVEEQIIAENRFNEDLGFDSLDMLDLYIAIKEEFSIIIPDATWANVITVGGLIHILQRDFGL